MDSHVWRDLVEVDSAVSLHVVLGVDLQLFVGVDGNQHGTDVGLGEENSENSDWFQREHSVFLLG